MKTSRYVPLLAISVLLISLLACSASSVFATPTPTPTNTPLPTSTPTKTPTPTATSTPVLVQGLDTPIRAGGMTFLFTGVRFTTEEYSGYTPSKGFTFLILEAKYTGNPTTLFLSGAPFNTGGAGLFYIEGKSGFQYEWQIQGPPGDTIEIVFTPRLDETGPYILYDTVHNWHVDLTRLIKP